MVDPMSEENLNELAEQYGFTISSYDESKGVGRILCADSVAVAFERDPRVAVVESGYIPLNLS
jgi:hypothetical protein